VLRSKRPETELFWKDFEKRLKLDPDVPWAAIRSRCYLQPSFIALSWGLIYGVDESRSRMEAHFTSRSATTATTSQSSHADWTALRGSLPAGS
jgi:hypothetical protein